MNKKKLFVAAGVALLSAGVLTACGSSSSSSSTSTYSYVYQTDPENLNYLVSSKSTTHDLTTNAVDGLLENDTYGNYVPSLAEDWSVSADGLTYTYKLREGVKWYTSDGEEYAEVKAQDFVTGLKYAADKGSEAIYLVENSVVGLSDYISGTTKDFSTVGVKAIDDYTVQYTLKQPEPFWNSKTTMGVLMPLNEEFLTSKGDDFAKADPSSILYNGPFILKSLTSKSSIEFAKNENYWDKDNVHIDAIKLSYYDGSDPESIINNFADGVYSAARVYPNSSSYSSVKEKFGKNIRYGIQTSGSFFIGTNIDRQTYDHTSKTTDAQKTSTKKALLNKDFRQAIAFAFNRTTFNAQANGEDGASKVLRNLLVPPTFVTDGDKTFGDIVEQDLVSYGDEWKDIDLSDGQDGLYSPEKAKAELEKAKTALQADGVEFPIHIDIPLDQSDTSEVAYAQSLKQSIEENLGTDNVVIDLQQMKSDDVNNITYYAPTAKEEDWDMTFRTGWLPDYLDPSTYLDIIRLDTGSNIHGILGVDRGTNNAATQAVGLEEYDKLLDEAQAETSNVGVRYEKYAAAQAWLTDSSLIIPFKSDGASPVVSKLVPFSSAFSWAGNKGSASFKYVKLQEETVTTEDYTKAREKWEKERVESNAKAQEELASHVK